MRRAFIFLLLIFTSSFGCINTQEHFTLVGSRTIQHGSRYGLYVDSSKLERDTTVIMRLRGQNNVMRRVSARSEHSQQEENQNVLEFNLDESVLGKDYKLSILSHRNGMCAYDEIPIFPVHKEYSVFIQMNKPLYKPKDIGKFRIVMIDENTQPYKPKSLEVRITEAKGGIVGTYKANVNQIRMGIYEDTFDISEEPNLGMWKISAIVNGRESEAIVKDFEVREYVLPLLKVNIESNSYLLHSDSTLRLIISAKYTFGILARGTAVVTANIYDESRVLQHSISKNLNIETRKAIDFDIVKDLKIKSTDSNRFIDIAVNFTDDMTGKTFSDVKKITFRDKNSFYIRVYNQKTFTAANHYEFYVSVKDFDGIPQILKTHPVTMRCEYGNNNLETIQPSFLENGFARFSWFVPKGATLLKITVTYRDTTRTFQVQPGTDTKNENFEASIDTKEPSLKQMITVHLNAISKLGTVNYAVTGRLGLVAAGSYNCQKSESCQITITPNEKMLPEATVMVYFVNSGGELVYDTTKVHFKSFSSNHLSIKPEKKTVVPGGKVNLNIESSPNSLVAILGIDEALTYLRIGHDIEDVDVIKDLLKFGHTDFTMKHPRAKIIENTFVYQQNFQNLHSCTAAEKTILNEAGLISIDYRFLSKRSIDDDVDYEFDYTIIPENPEDDDDPNEPRIRKDFREVFIHESVTVGGNGKSTIEYRMPDKITTWLITGFAMNENDGFALAEQTQIVTIQQMFVKLFLPYSIKFGEILKVEAVVFNFIQSKNPLKVYVTMIAGNSEDDEEGQQYFEFVEFHNCQPMTMSVDEMTKTVDVPQNSARSTFFHIRALKSGEIKILVKAKSSKAKDGVEQTLIVEHEGTNYYDTRNVEIDWKDKNKFSKKIEFKPSNETILDSIRFFATVTSTVIPIFPSSRSPAGRSFVESMIAMPSGCNEQRTRAFSNCVSAYDFLRSRNLLDDTTRSNFMSYINKGYQDILAFRSGDGSFELWGSNLWMTAYASMLLGEARDLISVNTDYMRQTLNYLAARQQSDGRFEGQGISESYTEANLNSLALKVKMTAFVLIAFMENSHLLGNHQNVIVNGLRYISENVDDANSNYATAISAYAFALADRNERAEDLLETLNGNAIVSGNNKHWTDDGSSSGSNILCAEISAYALLAHAKLGKLIEAVPIENWLISQRSVYGSYSSTFATAMSIHALAEIGKLKKIEVFNANIELKTDMNEVLNYDIKSTNITAQEVMPLKPATRMVTISASKTNGTGTCHASIEFQYKRRETDVKKNFDLNVYALQLDSRSASIRVCGQFIPDGVRDNVTMTLMEIDAPSGYIFDKSSNNLDTQNLLKFQKMELKSKDTRMNLYFESFSNVKVCPTLRLIKFNDVANQKKSTAKIYDYYTLKSRATTFYNIEQNSNCGS